MPKYPQLANTPFVCHQIWVLGSLLLCVYYQKVESALAITQEVELLRTNTLCHDARRFIAAAQIRSQLKASNEMSASAAYSQWRDVARGVRTAEGRHPQGVRRCWTVEGGTRSTGLWLE